MTADTILLVLQLYGLVGLIISVPFAIIGVGMVADGARGWGIGRILFRLWIIPGAAVVWPLVLAVWAKALIGRVRGAA
ncbi:MAG: hypothetical protein AB8H79_22770 [Myxococcota bacterium]